MADIAHASKSENKIAKRLLAAILKAGYVVSVFDGEEWTLRMCRSKGQIIAALGSTGYDVIAVRSPVSKGGERIGSITLIWGNGEDVISDHSDNDTIRKFVCYAQGEPFNPD